ncbi:MAG: tRNA (cytidine(56)-2'-O)-methyltransferase [Thermoplasmata archaeon]|nr:tRNA (cytidine(56)-2'-O)-methyltransferase [Thermoplasmata archaeon]
MGHRAGRDPRLTTHLALTARALGATRMLLHPPDPDLAKRVEAVVRRWGGRFEVLPAAEWRTTVRAFDGTVVHLTMYGLAIQRLLPRLRRARKVLLVVGGAKVPPDLYRLAHYNVAVGHQPHSEVAALAVALDRLLGTPRSAPLEGAQQRIVPRARGKRVVGGRARA